MLLVRIHKWAREECRHNSALSSLGINLIFSLCCFIRWLWLKETQYWTWEDAVALDRRFESETYSKIRPYEASVLRTGLKDLKLDSYEYRNLVFCFILYFFVVVIITIFSFDMCLYHRFYNDLPGTLSIELHRRIDVVTSHISQWNFYVLCHFEMLLLPFSWPSKHKS